MKNSPPGFRLQIALSAIILILVSFFVYDYYQSIRPSYLMFDEVDYANATKEGFIANYTDRESLSFVQFVKLSLLKAKKDSAAIDNYCKTLPVENTDPFILRHFHPSLPVYYWLFFTNSDPQQEAANLKFSNFLLALICMAVFLAACFKINRDRKNLFLIVLLSSLFFVSPAFFETFYNINFHVFHFIACLFYAYVLYRYIDESSVKAYAMIGASIAAITVTLEMSWFILFFTIVLLFLFRYRQVFRRKAFLIITGFSLLFVLALYPGFFYTGGTIKSLLFYVYRFLFMSGQEYSSVSPLNIWADFFKHNILFSAYIAAGLVFTWTNKKQIEKKLALIYILGWIYVVFMTPFILNSTYILPGMGMLALATTVIFVRYFKPFEYKTKLAWSLATVTIAATCALYFFNDRKTVIQQADNYAEGFNRDFAEIKKLIGNQKVYAEWYQLLNYYAGQNFTKEISWYDPNSSGFKMRQNYRYEVISTDRSPGKTFILRKSRETTNMAIKELQSRGYRLIELNEFVIAL